MISHSSALSRVVALTRLIWSGLILICVHYNRSAILTTSTIAKKSTAQPRRVGRKRKKRRRGSWSKKRKEEEEERGNVDRNGTESTGIELGNAHLSRTSYSRVPTVVAPRAPGSSFFFWIEKPLFQQGSPISATISTVINRSPEKELFTKYIKYNLK